MRELASCSSCRSSSIAATHSSCCRHARSEAAWWWSAWKHLHSSERCSARLCHWMAVQRASSREPGGSGGASSSAAAPCCTTLNGALSLLPLAIASSESGPFGDPFRGVACGKLRMLSAM